MKRLIACLMLAVVGIACQPLNEPPSDDTGNQLVAIFGDSLVAMKTHEIEDRFTADPERRLSFNAVGGTQLDTSYHTERFPSVPAGTVVLIFLGTNDIGCVAEPGGPCGEPDTLTSVKGDFRSAVAAVTNAGASRVVAVNVSEESAAVFHGGARLPITQTWNAWLRQADASTHPDYRALSVVDWSAISAGHEAGCVADPARPNDPTLDGPECWYSDDFIHHNPAGQNAYADFAHEAAL